ncbi:hypothetical protein SAMN06296008_10935 [Polynucleobacter kasalickyi]|uniref:Uncharacterized protein n=1 Tax=Polynucleobacter kasalickyi TaxID=1938817 RepID=A0A1W2AKD6_9BURK|nr:hypothetical protein SAMN06296008_10935 [Polynucleobacter kasalickyi]
MISKVDRDNNIVHINTHISILSFGDLTKDVQGCSRIITVDVVLEIASY